MEFEEKSGYFVMVNQIVHKGALTDSQHQHENSLLFLILSAIYLAEGELAEGNLFINLLLKVKIW